MNEQPTKERMMSNEVREPITVEVVRRLEDATRSLTTELWRAAFGDPDELTSDKERALIESDRCVAALADASETVAETADRLDSLAAEMAVLARYPEPPVEWGQRVYLLVDDPNRGFGRGRWAHVVVCDPELVMVRLEQMGSDGNSLSFDESILEDDFVSVPKWLGQHVLHEDGCDHRLAHANGPLLVADFHCMVCGRVVDDHPDEERLRATWEFEEYMRNEVGVPHGAATVEMWRAVDCFTTEQILESRDEVVPRVVEFLEALGHRVARDGIRFVVDKFQGPEASKTIEGEIEYICGTRIKVTSNCDYTSRLTLVVALRAVGVVRVLDRGRLLTLDDWARAVLTLQVNHLK